MKTQNLLHPAHDNAPATLIAAQPRTAFNGSTRN